jgi:arsenate reductase
MILKKVLFVCIHNSARSQMAESFINEFASTKFIAESAGIQPGNLNPFVVKAMQEVDIDISKNTTNSAKSFIEENRQYDYIITVCDQASAERCPVFPGQAKRVHLGFEDPSGLDGSDDDKLKETRRIRDQIQEKILDWAESV